MKLSDYFKGVGKSAVMPDGQSGSGGNTTATAPSNTTTTASAPTNTTTVAKPVNTTVPEEPSGVVIYQNPQGNTKSPVNAVMPNAPTGFQGVQPTTIQNVKPQSATQNTADVKYAEGSPTHAPITGLAGAGELPKAANELEAPKPGSGQADNYEQMIAELNRLYDEDMRRNAPLTAEQEAKQRKRRQSSERIAAIGDAFNALSNLYFTTQDAPNAYDPKNSLTDKARERWDKITKEREQKRQAYLNAVLGKYKIGSAKASMEMKRKAAEMEREVAAAKQKRADDEAKRKAAQQDWENTFKIGEAQRDQYNKEENRKQAAAAQKAAERHNRQMEAIGWSNANSNRIRAAKSGSGSTGSGKGSKTGPYTIRLKDGTVHEYSPRLTGAITGLEPTMIAKARVAADYYEDHDDYNNAEHFRAVADELESATSKDAKAAIIAANVGDFPTMDKQIRAILGVKKGQKPIKNASPFVQGLQKANSGNWEAGVVFTN